MNFIFWNGLYYTFTEEGLGISLLPVSTQNLISIDLQK